MKGGSTKVGTFPALLLEVALLVSSAAACTHSRSVQSTDETAIRRLDVELRDRTVRVVLEDGTESRGSVIAIDRDSLAWHGGTPAVRRAVEHEGIGSIVWRSWWRGLLDGATIGALVGAPMGALLIDSPSGGSDRRVEAALAGTAAGAIWGSVIGAIAQARFRVVIVPVRNP